MKVDPDRFEHLVRQLSGTVLTPADRRMMRRIRRYLDNSAKPAPEPLRIPASPVTLIALELTP